MYLNRYRDGGDGGINIWGIVGSAAHKAIELHYRERKPILETFLTRVNQATDHHVEGIENVTKVLYTIQEGLLSFDPTIYTPVALEKYFRLPYPNDQDPICTIEGYIDLTEENGIIDFKTGRDIPTKGGLKKDLQFIIYAWAFLQIYGKLPEYVVYHRLRNNKRYTLDEYDFALLDTSLRKFLDDPMEYDTEPCEECPLWCGVRRNAVNTLPF